MRTSTSIRLASAALAAGLATISSAAMAKDAGIPSAPTVIKTCASDGGALIPCAAHPGSAYGVPYSGNGSSSDGGLLGGLGAELGAIVTAPMTIVAGTTEPLITGRSVAVTENVPAASIPPAPTEIKSCSTTGGALIPCVTHPGSAYGVPYLGSASSSDGGLLGGLGTGIGAIVTAPVTIVSSALPK